MSCLIDINIVSGVYAVFIASDVLYCI